MSVLVTGGGGFIGSHLTEYILAETDEPVTVLDNFSTGSETNLAEISSDKIETRRADIRDAEAVTDAVQSASSVYHLAAAVGVQRVVENPLTALKTNLRGTENVLEAAALDDTPVFVASSSEVYGKSESLPFSETDDRVLGPTQIPRWGYAAAKATDEFLALSYHQERGLPVVVGRYFNIVGPRQTGEYGMVIPTFVDQALANEPITVYGDGTQSRSFTHVHDAVEMTYELLQTPAADGEVFNIGAPDPVSINELANRIIDLTGSDSSISHVPFEEVYGEDFEEPDRREPDVTKLRETIGTAPTTDLEQILDDVISERQDDTGATA
jgi:UDP-glucose 4-epimerase